MDFSVLSITFSQMLTLSFCLENSYADVFYKFKLITLILTLFYFKINKQNSKIILSSKTLLVSANLCWLFSILKKQGEGTSFSREVLLCGGTKFPQNFSKFKFSDSNEWFSKFQSLRFFFQTTFAVIFQKKIIYLPSYYVFKKFSTRNLIDMKILLNLKHLI